MDGDKGRSITSAAEITAYVVEALAEVRCQSPEELTQEIAASGDPLIMTAKETMVVAAMIEDKIGGGLEFKPSDFASEKTLGGKQFHVSSNACMDSAEDTPIDKFVSITLAKLGQPVAK